MRSLLSPVRAPRVLFMCSGGGGGGGDGGSDDDDDDDGGGFFGGYTSISDMFDGGGAGGSGDTHFSGSHDDYVSSGGTGGVAHNNDDDDDDDSAPAATTSNDNDSGGYTSIIDMFDGGGAGGSGSEFFSGTHDEYLATDAGAADAASDAAGTTNYSAGSYTGLGDMLDGGGPNNSGDTFEGPLSDVGDFVTSGGITGAVLGGLGNVLGGTTPVTSSDPPEADQPGARGGAATSSGYTSITDMIDGGGPGASGDTFGGALGGISNAVGATPFGSGIEPTGPAGVIDDLIDNATNYDGFSDMIDGGGPGASGDEFGGALGGISNAIGATPAGSDIEPTGIAGLVSDGIVGGVNTIGDIVNNITTPSPTVNVTTPDIVNNITTPDIFIDNDTPDVYNEVVVNMPTEPEEVITPFVEQDTSDIQVGVATVPTYTAYDPVVGGGVVPAGLTLGDPNAVPTYTPSPQVQNMADFYAASAAQNYQNSPFMPAQFVPQPFQPPASITPTPPPAPTPTPPIYPTPTPTPTPLPDPTPLPSIDPVSIDPPTFTTMAVGEEDFTPRPVDSGSFDKAQPVDLKGGGTNLPNTGVFQPAPIATMMVGEEPMPTAPPPATGTPGGGLFADLLAGSIGNSAFGRI